MKYLIIFFLLVISIYPLNFAKYNWDQNNKLGAAGVLLLAVLSVAIPSVMLIMD
ncbi:MAG: hypothetical protein ACM3UZ_01060 [Acidobacteriota bacterium]